MEYCRQPLGQEQPELHLVERREVLGAAPPVAYYWTFPLAASTRMVCHLVAVVAAGSLGMWVASGSTVVAESVDGAGRAAADSADIDSVPHSIGSALRVLQVLLVDRQGLRVGHWVGVRCEFPTAVGDPGEDIGHGTGHPANHRDTSAVAVGTVDTVVGSFQSPDASLAD